MIPVKTLVVENEKIIAIDIKNSLTNSGYAIPAIVFSGKEAIEKAAEFQPDLVLMAITIGSSQSWLSLIEQVQTDCNHPQDQRQFDE